MIQFSCVRVCDHMHTYVNRPETSTVPRGHILVEGLYGIGTSELTELLVHVVRAGARVVAEPDTEVLDLQGLLLMDLKRHVPWTPLVPTPPAT